jgi:hypothetical protein
LTLKEFSKEYKSKNSIKLKTEYFNQLSITDRNVFLRSLSENEKKDFISKIRTQAVKDFWTHEQALIKEGKCTRDWTPEQVEEILNISEKTGIISINGEAAIDLNGKKYYGHHMKSVAEFPEYAGDWRNIQALEYKEHYLGAHQGNTHKPTDAFYNPETESDEPIDEAKLEKSQPVETGKGYIDERKCIFKSDAEINNIYDKFGTINDGERLALKNIEFAKSRGNNLTDFTRAMDVVVRYKCQNFEEKFGINRNEFIVGSFTQKNDTDLEPYTRYTKSERDKMKPMGDCAQETNNNQVHRIGNAR